MAFASLALESDQLALMQTAAWIDWSAVLYVSLGSSLIGHAGSFYLLKHYEVSVVAPLMLLAPISTVVFGILLLGDVMTPRMIVGTLVALTGVLIVMLRQAKKIPPVPLD